MSWSATEIVALASKAARGAGVPAGQAARFGEAAMCHLMAGRDADQLRSALDDPRTGPILMIPLLLDKALLAPSENQPLSVPRDLLHSYVEALPFNARLVVATNQWHLVLDRHAPKAVSKPGRITGYAALLDIMTGLAERTYVPDSDASRAAGAGAGLSDND